MTFMHRHHHLRSTLLNDFAAKSQVVQLKKDNEEMVKAKGEICSRILENQRKIASLESDSSTLSQVAIPYYFCLCL